MLYLRCQVEDYAFSDRKWGSPEALDDEFIKRQAEKKERKEKKFKSKLEDLKKRTRVEAWRRGRRLARGGEGGGGGGENNGANFGDDVSSGGGGGKHVHEWSRAIDDAGGGGLAKKTCTLCGMEVEELEF